MTVVGIALIAGGLATFVIFWRVLWGSFRRREPEAAAGAVAEVTVDAPPETQLGGTTGVDEPERVGPAASGTLPASAGQPDGGRAAAAGDPRAGDRQSAAVPAPPRPRRRRSAAAGAVRPGREAPEPAIGSALQDFAHLGSVGREAADAEDTSVVVTSPDERTENPAVRSVGYRYGDRIKDWVRPSYPPTAPAAGDYWLPVDGRPAHEQSPYQGWSPSERPAGYGVAPAVQPMPAPAFEPAAVIEAARVPISLGEPALVPEGAPEVPEWLPRPPKMAAAGIRPATAEQPPGPGTEGAPHVALSGAPDDDPGQPHFPRRRRGSTVQRNSVHLGAEPPAEPAARRTPPRGETRRRIIVPQSDLGAAPEATQALPAGEGYGRTGSERVDGVRSREVGQPGRPRPRPRPRSGDSQPAEEREPVRSTVYVSRHAAEPG